MEKYYLAYGSNLSMAQMATRCPNARYVGTADLEGYQLLFKGSQTGSYLTVEPKQGSKVPVLVWEISEHDESNLDRYEGFPAFYYKKQVEVKVWALLNKEPIGTVEAVIYIMHEDRPLGCPNFHYYDICYEGYCRFGFERNILQQALMDSIGKRSGKQFLKEVGYYE